MLPLLLAGLVLCVTETFAAAAAVEAVADAKHHPRQPASTQSRKRLKSVLAPSWPKRPFNSHKLAQSQVGERLHVHKHIAQTHLADNGCATSIVDIAINFTLTSFKLRNLLGPAGHFLK